MTSATDVSAVNVWDAIRSIYIARRRFARCKREAAPGLTPGSRLPPAGTPYAVAVAASVPMTASSGSPASSSPPKSTSWYR